MGSPEDADKDSPGSNTLLSEILSVLKRIDGHLEHQEKRISVLDSKLTSLTVEEKRPQLIAAPSGRDVYPTAPPSPEKARRGALPLSTSITRHRDLTVLTSNRNDSVDSRNAPDSVSNFSIDDTREPGPMFRRGPFRAVPTRADNGRRVFAESPKARNNSIAKFSAPSRSGTWNSLLPPPSSLGGGYDEEITESHDLSSYAKFPPPHSWIITRTQGRALEVKYGSQEAQALWRSYIGDSWTIPPDGRIEMTFQQHILERLDKAQALLLLETLRDVSSKLEYRGPSDIDKRGSFKVKDYDFDPDYEVSVAEYRADIPIGQVRRHRVKDGTRRSSMDESQSAPWKRIIEVRGLSKKLLNDHEMWTSNFRDPWNEALPIVNPVCPFLTNRISDHSHGTFTGMRTVHDALHHHQQCWRRPPPCDDDLCFHITFYELVDLADEDELEGELWRSGKLHSDNEDGVQALYGVKCRRMRESACTIISVPDIHIPQYWTILYLCPNTFDQYDKDHSVERYDTISAAIKDQDTAGGLDLMIEFTIRMVIERWDKIGDYFAWLIGHRDTLSDPNAHDSLLFDDDSFSRSRRYFWAINYLAELDISISENIVQLERFVKTNKTLQQQLTQLRYHRGRLRDQRNEAIALRDGLFSASGVMESRASTRLGENIKLLTFVSIFFLPLSFCISIWSINDNLFSLRALLISVFLVGFTTYFIVFNLGSLAAVLTSFYCRRKSYLVEQMKTSSDPAWRKTGKRFVTFQPRNGNVKLSEWTIVLFIFHKMSTIFRRKKGLRKGSDSDSQTREKRAAPTQDVLSWQDMELPAELSEEKMPPITTTKSRKTSSIKDSFARIGRAFTSRRGALSTSPPPPPAIATAATV